MVLKLRLAKMMLQVVNGSATKLKRMVMDNAIKSGAPRDER